MGTVSQCLIFVALSTKVCCSINKGLLSHQQNLVLGTTKGYRYFESSALTVSVPDSFRLILLESRCAPAQGREHNVT